MPHRLISYDFGNAIAVWGDSSVVVVGNAGGSGFPLKIAAQTTFGGAIYDAFSIRID